MKLKENYTETLKLPKQVYGNVHKSMSELVVGRQQGFK